jgi:uncharacterized membrane protein YbhN (UPF0104 family)
VRNRRISLLVQITLSMGVLIFLFFRIDLRQMAGHFRDLQWVWLIGIVNTLLGDRAVMAYKWNLLLVARGIHIPGREVFKVYYFSSFVGMFLPVSVGGDVVRGLKLYHDGHGGAEITSSIVIERILGLAAGAIVSVVCTGVLITWLKIDIFPLLFFSLAILAGFVVVFAISLDNRLLSWLPFKENVIVRKIIKFHESYSGYRRHGAILLAFLGLSIVEQIFPILSHYCAAKSMQLTWPFWTFLMILPVVQLVARMPISFNGLGVIEGMLAYVFARLAYSETDAVMIGLIVEVVSALTMVPALFLKIKTK